MLVWRSTKTPSPQREDITTSRPAFIYSIPLLKGSKPSNIRSVTPSKSLIGLQRQMSRHRVAKPTNAPWIRPHPCSQASPKEAMRLSPAQTVRHASHPERFVSRIFVDAPWTSRKYRPRLDKWIPSTAVSGVRAVRWQAGRVHGVKQDLEGGLPALARRCLYHVALAQVCESSIDTCFS